MFNDDDGAMKELQRIMADVVTQARDERRPGMEDVVRVISDAFTRLRESGEMDVVLEESGPLCYRWRDMGLAEAGFEKVYVLTGSVISGAEGFPLLTVRQVVAPLFDAQLTFSTLVFGPSDEDISRSVAMLITNHAAAFQGLKESISTIASHGTMAALEKIKEARDDLAAEIPVTSVIPPKGELN